MIFMYLFIIFFQLFTLQLIDSQNAEVVELTITNIQAGTGNILVSVYENANQFPYDPFVTYSIDKSTISKSTVVYKINDLQPAKKYAITLLDDENKNEDMDYNLVGIPKEGYGFSNNAKPRFLTAPTFEDCSFSPQESISIKMKYW